MGRPHARVVDPVAAARVQLRRGPAGRAPRRLLAPQVHRGRRGPAGAAARAVARDAGRRADAGERRPRHPHAVAVVLPAGHRARPADPRLRRGVPELVARSRASSCSCFGMYAWAHRARDRRGGTEAWRRSTQTTERRRTRRRRPAVTATTRTPPRRASRTPSSRCGCSCRRTACSSAPSSRRTCSTAAAPARPGPTPKDVFDIPFTSVTSFILLMSSLTMVLALAAIQRGDHRRFRIWLLATALFGADVHRRPDLRVHRVLPRGPHARARTCSARRFFVLTGFHGAHVTIGIIWLLSLWGLSMQGRLPTEQARAVEIAASTGTSSTSCGS